MHAAIRFTVKHFNTGVCQAIRDALSLLISSTCRCWTLRNPEKWTTIWCWMSRLQINLFRLFSSETYSSFQFSLEPSHQIKLTGYNISWTWSRVSTKSQRIDWLDNFLIITAIISTFIGILLLCSFLFNSSISLAWPCRTSTSFTKVIKKLLVFSRLLNLSYFYDLNQQPEFSEAFWMKLNFNIFHSLYNWLILKCSM